jgi:AcrR family transcriptional regulator
MRPRSSDGAGSVRATRTQTMHDASRAVVQLYVDTGRTDYTVTELAVHANISERSFYRYFPRKEDAIRPFLAHGFERIALLTANRPADEPIQEALVAAWANSWAATEVKRSRKFFRILFQDEALLGTWFQVMNESEARWAQVVAQRIGIDPTSQQAALIGSVVVAAARLSAKSFADVRPGVDPTQNFAMNLELIGTALFTPPTRSQMER